MRSLFLFILLCIGLSTKSHLSLNINTFNDDAIAGTAYQVLRTDTSAVAARGTTGTHSGTKLVT